jgi:voltage-gated potassium channel Kch
VVGLGRFGRELMHELRDGGIPVLGVDFDPVGVRSWQSDDIPVLYGEAEDPELPAAIPLERTRWVVSTLRNVDANIAVIQHLRHHGYRGAFATSAHTDEEAARLHAAGSNMVVNLFRTAAAPIVDAIALPRTHGSSATSRSYGYSIRPARRCSWRTCATMCATSSSVTCGMAGIGPKSQW